MFVAIRRLLLASVRPPSPARKRRLFLEPLEGRQLLAITDLAAIGGVVFDDFSGDGADPGELIDGATINLYADDGDGVFQPGGADGAPVATATTNAAGEYQFADLSAGGYFVEQPAQTVGSNTLLADESGLITITAADAQGTTALSIDNFNTTTQSVTDSTNDATAEVSALPAAEAQGGERDLFVNLTSAMGSISLRANDLAPGLLAFDSASGGSGERRVTWDGADGDADVVDDTGLGGVDLTANDAVGLRLDVGADLAGANAVVRIYSDDSDGATRTMFSTLSVNIPVTGGVATEEFLLRFSDFTTGGATAADFTSAGAIELEIAGASNVNGFFDLVGTAAPTIFTQDFDNFEQADVSVTKAVDEANPNVGDNVTFTITASNAGPDGATGVIVSDTLPAGLTFVSSTPSQGAYDETTGVWTVGSLAGGANATLSLTATVASLTSQTNTAEVTASEQFDPDSTVNNNVGGEDDQDDAVVTPQIADLSVTKSVDEATPNVGQNVTFTVTVSNDGPDDATNVTVGDTLPAGFTFVSSTPSQGSYNDATGVWSVGDLANAATATLQISATVTASGAQTNIAEVTSADQADSDSTPNNSVAAEDDQADATVTPQIADLSVTKVVDESSPALGQNVTFTVTVANAGPDAASNVTVGDALPADMTFVSSTPSQGAYDEVTGVWTVGGVASGGDATLEIVASVDTTGVKTNTAEVTAVDQADSDSTPNNSQAAEDDQASATITPQAIDLSLVKAINNSTPNVGDTVTYTIVLSNAGPDEATNVSVTDALPAGMTFATSNPSQGSYDAATGVWTVGALVAAADATLTIDATVDTIGVKTNVAEVSAADQTDVDSTPNNSVGAEDDQDEAVLTPQSVDLSLTKTVDDASPAVGQNVVFTVTVNNAGPDTATNVAVSDPLPAELTLVTATPSTGSYDAATGVWTLGSLAAGASADLSITASVDSQGTKTNLAQISAADQADVDSTPGNDLGSEDDQASVDVTPPAADLSVTKTVDNATPNINDNVVFTVTVSNAGPNDATNVAVQDALPAGLTFVSSTPSQGNYVAGTDTWTVGTLANGATATLSVTATVVSFGAQNNIAQVAATDQFDPDSTPANDAEGEDDQANVLVQPILSLSKRLFLAR